MKIFTNKMFFITSTALILLFIYLYQQNKKNSKKIKEIKQDINGINDSLNQIMYMINKKKIIIQIIILQLNNIDN